MINLLATLKEIEEKITAAIKNELSDLGVETEDIRYLPELKGCLVRINGKELIIPVSVSVSKTGSYSASYQLPELVFLPEYEIFYQGKHRIRASSPYYAAYAVLKRLGSKFPDLEAKKILSNVIPIEKEINTEKVVEIEYEKIAEKTNLLHKFVSSIKGPNIGLKPNDEQVIMRIIQREFDQVDVPVVVSSVSLENDKGVYHVESMADDIDYKASLPVKITKRENGNISVIACMVKPVKRVFGVKIFEVKLPDNEIITVETISEEKALKAAKEYWRAQKGSAKFSSENSFEIVGAKEYEEKDFSEDYLLNPWATILVEQKPVFLYEP
uniref:Uncharacterized protein n=1 Tax=Fervidicoccus fontis TaxID=683846 RepID=A0A7J3SN45_9CREN